jgi:L-iditol 2-dehydrogenase
LVSDSRIGGRVVLAGIPDGDAHTLPASEARQVPLQDQARAPNGRRRAIDLVTPGRANIRTLATHRKSLDAASEALEALAQNQLG